jgi:hypothetical protein
MRQHNCLAERTDLRINQRVATEGRGHDNVGIGQRINKNVVSLPALQRNPDYSRPAAHNLLNVCHPGQANFEGIAALRRGVGAKYGNGERRL